MQKLSFGTEPGESGRIGASGARLAAASIAAFLFSFAFLFALAPSAPFTRALGVCESGAVRDVLSGHVILPYYWPGKMVQVPPFYWWTAALSVRMLGWNEMALRLPSLIAGAGTCAILYCWMAATIETGAAAWAVVVLISSRYLTDAARQPRMDALLAMFLTGAFVCLERAHANGPGSGRRRTFLVGAALFMGLGILTKSVLGVILPGLGIAIYLIVRGRMRELFRPALIGAFAAAVAVGAAWYGAALAIGGEQFFRWQIKSGLFGRFFGFGKGKIPCHHPFYYFVPRFLGGFLPWSLYLPAMAAALWFGRKALSEQVVFAACWFVAIFGFFSLSAGKCLVYILPAFPPIAVLIGWLLRERARALTPAVRRLFDIASAAVALGVLAIVGAGIALAVTGAPAWLVAHMHPSGHDFLMVFLAMVREVAPRFMLWAIAWVFGAVAVLIALRQHRPRMSSLGIGAIALAGAFFWFGAMNPTLAREQTLKSFVKVIDSKVPPGNPVYYVGHVDCDVRFYSDREISRVRRFSCEPNSDHDGHYFIFWHHRFADLRASKRECLNVLAKSRPVDSHGARFLVVREPKGRDCPTVVPRKHQPRFFRVPQG